MASGSGRVVGEDERDLRSRGLGKSGLNYVRAEERDGVAVGSY